MSDTPDCRHEMPSGQTGLCYDESGEYVDFPTFWIRARSKGLAFCRLLVLCGSDGTFRILRGENDDDPQTIEVGFGDINSVATKVRGFGHRLLQSMGTLNRINLIYAKYTC